ncbi:class I SAM-dependent methyltransferase [Roseibium sp.]|uniref:class I SAM-dependent methyltransferase n=2 Tax=Roseibium sp. TaxID=1936156 RepID=UPI003D0D737A
MLHLHFKADADPSNILDTDALEIFQFEWGIYQTLVQSNSMNHREIADLLRELIDTHFDRPFTFIDLACGDSSLAHTVLEGSQVARYEGLDLSRPALQCGAEIMKEVPYEVDLDEEDMVAGIARRPESADMIWCGFSIHHLRTDQKQEMLASIRQALKPGGIFVCVEPVNAAGETRADYTGRWHHELKKRFAVLSDEEFDHIWDHIRTHDFPETPETWVEMGEKAGFSKSRQVFRMPGDLFCGGFLFEK